MNDDAGRVGGTTPAVPTCAGPPGIRFDVNDGCRIRLPPGDRRGRLTDLETGGVPCDIPCPGGTVRSAERYFVRYHVELWLDGVPVFSHRLDLAGREVLIRPELGGLGDQLAWAAQAWAAQAAAFAAAHGARVTCCVTPALVPLLAPMRPGLRLATAAELAAEIGRAPFHATYKVCIVHQVGLCHVAAHMLGLAAEERRPAVAVDPGGRRSTAPMSASGRRPAARRNTATTRRAGRA